MTGNCGYEIEYNGHLLSEYGGVIGGFNRDAIQEVNGQGEFEVLGMVSQLSPFKFATGGRYSDTLQRDKLSVCFIDNNGLGIDSARYAEFAHNFFNKQDYHELKFPDDRLRKDYTWMARLYNPQKKECNGYIYEVDFSIDYNCPYAKFNDEVIEFTSVTSSVVKGHNCESHQDNRIYPTINIKAKGDVTIWNKTNGSKFIVNCTNGDSYEEIKIDELLQITTNNSANNPKLKHGVTNSYK